MKHNIISIGIVIMILYLFNKVQARAWYVHPDSTQNCIQDCLDSCATGDTVLVGPGTYFENIVWPSTQSIHLISELGPTVTIIDGDCAGSVIKIDFPIDTTTTIRGFTIQNGYAEYGGGIYCSNSSLSLKDMLITENITYTEIPDVYSGGGGICFINSVAYLSDLTINLNRVLPDTIWYGPKAGGGIYCTNSILMLSNVCISGNIVGPDTGNSLFYGSGVGGGIYCNHSSLIMGNVLVNNNVAQANGCGSSASGGGICCDSNSRLNLVNVTLKENEVLKTSCHGDAFGAGLSGHDYSFIRMANVTIMDNVSIGYRIDAYSSGGGISLRSCSLVVVNGIITGNTCGGYAGYGGGIYCVSAKLCLINVTFSDNNITAPYGNGGAISCTWWTSPPSNCSLSNCILWNDTPQELWVESSIVIADYSDIQGGWSGTGNIDTDPLFEGGPLSDYHLSSNSPCIDAGNPDSQYNDPEDPTNPGFALWPAQGTLRNDMGVYGGPGSARWIGIEEQRQTVNSVIKRNVLGPTIFAGNLQLTTNKKYQILDITGRKVADVKSGANNIRHLAPGVYFIRSNNNKEVTKIIVTR